MPYVTRRSLTSKIVLCTVEETVWVPEPVDTSNYCTVCGKVIWSRQVTVHTQCEPGYCDPTYGLAEGSRHLMPDGWVEEAHRRSAAQ